MASATLCYLLSAMVLKAPLHPDREPAVEEEGGAGDEIGGVRGEVDSGPGAFFGVPNRPAGVLLMMSS